MSDPFEFNIPENLTFQDYLAICQTARTWADGYDLKSMPHLLPTIAPTVTVDYSALVPSWGTQIYSAREFADLWLGDEHHGNMALATQHLLGQPYFEYVGSSSGGEGEVDEVRVSWQILASHGRRVPIAGNPSSGEQADTGNMKEKIVYEGPMVPVSESSDHRSFVTHRFVKVEVDGKKRWKIAGVKPSVTYLVGDFMRVRRGEGKV